MAWKIDGVCKIKSMDLSFELVGLLVDELTSWRVSKSGGLVGLIVDELASWRVDKLASWQGWWVDGLVGRRVDKLTDWQEGWGGGFDEVGGCYVYEFLCLLVDELMCSGVVEPFEWIGLWVDLWSNRVVLGKPQIWRKQTKVFIFACIGVCLCHATYILQPSNNKFPKAILFGYALHVERVGIVLVV